MIMVAGSLYVLLGHFISLPAALPQAGHKLPVDQSCQGEASDI